MKKTIAKIMAAAMLVASLPAMAMPTFNVEAGAGGVSVSAIKFDGTYANGTYAYMDGDNKVSSNASAWDGNTTLLLEKNFGMETVSTNKWNTNIVFIGDDFNPETKQGTAVAGRTLISGVLNDYTDETDTVKTITTDGKGKVTIEFDATKMGNYKTGLQKGNSAKTIKFYPFDRVNDDETAKLVDFEIQIGQTLNLNKATEIKGGVQTPDAFIQDATVVIESNGSATLKSITETDRKVNMKDQDLEISEVVVAGVTYEVKKFDDKALKKGTMKTIKAANIKNLGTGALRNCKKLRKVRMGSAKMRKIHSNAFYDCGKLKNIKINCKNLKSVGSKAFMKLKKNCQISIKAGKSKYNKVVKMIKKSGTDQVKFKRV